VPVHPPKFSFAKDLLNSFNRYTYFLQADMVFVFSSQEDYLAFDEFVDYLIVPEHIAENKKNNAINKKKLYAIKKLKEKYKYILVLDADCIFMRYVDLEMEFDDYFQRRVLYGNKAFGIEITCLVQNSARSHFGGNKDYHKTENRLYLWFNQPSIYKCDHIDDFFSAMDFDEDFSTILWQDFDYYLYMYYLILYRDFTIVDLGIVAYFSVCEAKEVSLEKAAIVNDNYKTAVLFQARKNVYRQLSPVMIKDTFFLIIHCDRG
jgi:hypothetical protein